MSYLLALDQGTTSSHAIVFDREGAIQSVAQQEFRQIYPEPGWVEHDPHDIWTSQVEVATQALAQAGLHPRDIAAIGITNQRETTVLWDRETGEPIHNAIVWQDRRTASFCDTLKAEGAESQFQQKTGLRLDPYFSGTKLRWLLDHVEGARERAERGELAFGTVDSWLVWKLTNGALHITDVTNASRTLLYNIHRGMWDDDLLNLLDIPPSVLPEVRASSEVYGETRYEGFATPIPVAGIAGDQQAALFGQVCTQQGMVKGTYGTGAFLLQNTGSTPIISQHDLLTTVAWQIGNQTEYALEGSIFVAGAVVQWLRDELGLIEQSAEVEALAAQVADNGGVYLVPAFTGLGAPHWNPHARGMVVGLTRGSKDAHLARAALESIAYQTADVVGAIMQDSGIELKELRVDGGASRNNLLMQFHADLLGVPVVRPQVSETTALGAAYLAGLGVGLWDDAQEIAAQWRVDRRFTPQMGRDRAQDLMNEWNRAVTAAHAWSAPPSSD